MTWRYFATRLTGNGENSDVLVNELPLSDVGVSSVLSGPNSLTGTVSPRFNRLVADDGRPVLEEWGTCVWAEADGAIMGGGILVDSSFDGPQWSIDCMGFTGYPKGLPYTDSNFWVETDALDIYRAIWEHVQGKPGGDLGLEFDMLKSGVKIGTERKIRSFDPQDDPDTGPTEFESGPYRLAWYQNHDLGGDIDDLASNTPFDYRERHFWEGDVLRHHVDLGYPKLGKRRENLRFEIGVNVAPPSINPNGDEYASESLVLGAGEGRTMIRGYAVRKDPRLRRVAVVTVPHIRTTKLANKRARRDVARRLGVGDIEEIVVDGGHPAAPMGSYQVGDEILVEGDVPWWDDVDTWVRILSITYSPENDGNFASLSVVRTDKLPT